MHLFQNIVLVKVQMHSYCAVALWSSYVLAHGVTDMSQSVTFVTLAIVVADTRTGEETQGFCVQWVSTLTSSGP